jgi:hypothetical protein
MKELLCQAFCDDLEVHQLPGGNLAVSTTFQGPNKDPIGFYVMKQEEGSFRIEDDGRTYPMLEASGVDFRAATRREAFDELLSEYGVDLDEEAREFFMEVDNEEAIPAAAMKFVAFSLRIRDFFLMTEYRVANTFRQDAERMLKEVVGDRAVIKKNEPVSDATKDIRADFIIRAKERPPIAVFLSTSEARIWEAIVLKMRTDHETHENVYVAALLEDDRSIKATLRQQALNRLHAVAEFRGDEAAAIERITRDVLPPAIH